MLDILSLLGFHQPPKSSWQVALPSVGDHVTTGPRHPSDVWEVPLPKVSPSNISLDVPVFFPIAVDVFQDFRVGHRKVQRCRQREQGLQAQGSSGWGSREHDSHEKMRMGVCCLLRMCWGRLCAQSLTELISNSPNSAKWVSFPFYRIRHWGSERLWLARGNALKWHFWNLNQMF